LGFAEKAGLNKARFQTCYDKQESKDAVEADRQEAAALHLESTPAFLINGRIVHGFRDFALFKETIDTMLAEKTQKK
jgi:predicted DsbA family dithiol-disulfide isomerase